MAGETIIDPKQLLNPPSGSGRHPCEMDMKVVDSGFLQSISEIDCFKKTVLVPAIYFFSPMMGEPPRCPTSWDFEKWAVRIRQIMDCNLVQWNVYGTFVIRPPNGENRNPIVLTIEFCHLARAKRFRKSGEPLKKVS